MNKLILPQNETMSHIEIAKLVNSRPDKVKLSMERLANKLIIRLTPLVEVNHLGQTVTNYYVNERDSYVVVAQLSPEFTAYLVDEWQKRKSHQLPDFTNPALAARAWADEVEAKQAAQLERDHAIATKAQINDKRTATLMNKASQDAKRINKLEQQVQDAGEYRSIRAMKTDKMIDTGGKKPRASHSVLKEISMNLGLKVIKIDDQLYGQVNGYHVNAFKELARLYPKK
jgi:phage regulator Rha-like protein